MIFQSIKEDFFKIFITTLIVWGLTFIVPIQSSRLMLILTIYFLDAGHVYSTLLEVAFDPEEVRKKYVWIVFLGTFFSCFLIHLFFKDDFFFVVFYFTVFHNMRQGLGVTFLYRKGVEGFSPTFYKWCYYFLTVIPFLLFHVREPLKGTILGEGILKPYYFSEFLNPFLLKEILKYGITLYILGLVTIFSRLIMTKNTKGIWSMLFFTFVYAYAFLISNNDVVSYFLFIFSHAVPYYFMMEKRIKLTHKSAFVRKYAVAMLLVLFSVGGLIDYAQNKYGDVFEWPLDSIAIGLFSVPLISHFIFDAIIWKRGNERFKTFISINRSIENV